MLAAMFLYGCEINSAAKDPDYVEVTSVRVPSAAVYLSPSGDTARYQLQAYVFPENATNKKLNYYVSPLYAEYFSVNQDGLIEAHRGTTELETQPEIKIYSSSNKNAYTTVKVYVEDVSVKEIFFLDEDDVAIQEIVIPVSRGTYDLKLGFNPYHAQDGRNVAYISQNPEIASVTPMGVLTLEKPGIVTIIARGTTLDGSIVEGRLRIIVAYANEEYRLDVTNDDPRYDQVIGEPQKISFHLLKLNPLSDPNPKIFWYVGGIRQSQQDNKWEYEHIPNETNPTSYYVTARVEPKNSAAVVLTSQEIRIHFKFTGFSLNMNEPATAKYYYGEDAVLNPLLSVSNVDELEWYIKQSGEKGLGELIAVTDFAENNGALTYRVMREGPQKITVIAKNNGNTIERKEIDLNVVRYISDDKLIIKPVGNASEKVPESYDWYLHRYFPENPESLRIGTGVLISTTVKDEALIYSATEEGYYVISAIPTVDGALVTSIVDGSTVIMREYTQPFRIWNKSGVSNIFDIAVDGITIGGSLFTAIRWNAVGGLNNFVIEVECGGKAYIIDTQKGDTEGYGISFLDNAIALPQTMANLSKDITVRVKQIGGVYSERILYRANTFAAVQSAYFTELSPGVNRVISNISELGNLIRYIMNDRPESLVTKIEGEYYTYGVSIFTMLKYSDLDENLYPIRANIPSGLTNSQTSMFRLVYAAINAYCPQIATQVGVNTEGENFYKIFITLRRPGALSYQEAPARTFIGENLEFTDESRPEGYTDFNSTLKSGINVSTSEEILIALERGRNPIPVPNSEAAAVYAEIKVILNSIISEKMSQAQKVEAIYNFIVKEIEFDTALHSVTKLASKPADWRDWEGFYLISVFNRQAVSEGIAKLFSVMCWLEGITTYRVKGEINGDTRHWNKVYVGEWYNVDATAGRIQFSEGENRYAAFTHKYLMVSDETLASYGYSIFGKYPEANTDYDIQSPYIIHTTNSDYQSAISAIIDEGTENQVYEIYFEVDSREDILTLLYGYTVKDLGTSLLLIIR